MSEFPAIGRPDTITIVNGPEDGTAFPITQKRFHVGQEPGSHVTIRLDQSVQPFHAEVSVVADGYRFRASGAAPVFVRNRKAGILRSRIARHGDVVRVGHTLLCVDCTADGLASRSRGMPLEHDAVYLAKSFGAELGRGTASFLRFFFGSLRRLLGSWLGVSIVLVLLYFFWPAFHWRVNYAFWYLGRFIAGLFHSAAAYLS